MLAIFLNFYTSKELADQLKNKFYKAIGEGELLHDGIKFQLKWCNNNPYWRKVQLNGKLISIMQSGVILNKDCNSRIGNGGFHRKNFQLYTLLLLLIFIG